MIFVPNYQVINGYRALLISATQRGVLIVENHQKIKLKKQYSVQQDGDKLAVMHVCADRVWI